MFIIGCNICNSDPEICAKWTKDLTLKKKRIQDACIEFKMDPLDVIDHLDKHAIPVVDEVDEEPDIIKLMESPEFLYKELYGLFTSVKSWLEFTMENERLDRTSIDMGIKLTREIRDTLKFIAELQGKLNKGDTYQIQYNQIHGDFNSLVGVILNELDDVNQLKVLKAIEKSPGMLPNGKSR